MSRSLTHWVEHHTYYLNTSITPIVCVTEEREDGDRGEREGEGMQTLSLRVYLFIIRGRSRTKGLVLVVTQLVTGNCSPDQTLKKPKYLSVCDRERGEGDVYMCDRVV